MSSVVRSRKSKPKRPNRPLSPEEKFQQQWDKIQRLRQQNEQLPDEVAKLAAWVTQVVETEERAYLDVLCEQCQRLIRFVGRKALPQYLREELVAWIGDGLEEIRSNPFGRHLDLRSLHERLEVEIRDYFAHEKAKVEAKYGPLDDKPEFAPDESPLADEKAQGQKSSRRAGRDHATQDLFEDLFAEFGDPDEPEQAGPGQDSRPGQGRRRAAGATEEDESDDFAGFHEEQWRAREEQERQEQLVLEQLLKSSSINRMFRQVTAAIHPDRARDDEERALRHEIMTRLTTARDRKDVLTIFALYAEHVGEPPASVFSGDLDKLMQLLVYQERLLLREREEIIYANPAQGAIYQRFASRSKAQMEKKLREHRQYLIRQTGLRERLCAELTSVASLRLFLEDRLISRRDAMFEELLKGPR